MKRTVNNSIENVSFDNFKFDVLSENEMKEVRGGGKPRSRDKDVYDVEELL